MQQSCISHVPHVAQDQQKMHFDFLLCLQIHTSSPAYCVKGRLGMCAHLVKQKLEHLSIQKLFVCLSCELQIVTLKL